MLSPFCGILLLFCRFATAAQQRMFAWSSSIGLSEECITLSELWLQPKVITLRRTVSLQKLSGLAITLSGTGWRNSLEALRQHISATSSWGIPAS